MIPHITKGGDMRGLLGYLASTDSRDDPRANQHENPRIVGGDAFLVSVYGGQELSADRQAMRDVADYLDRPRQRYGVESPTRVWRQGEDGTRVAVLGGDGAQKTGDQHVWHASLSLAEGESLTDDQWGRLAEDFAARVGFTGVDGHASARWVAVHHGAGKGGHDHLHVAASMVREDGTKWSPYRDYGRAQQACRALEVEWGLVRVGGAEHGTATRGATPAELGHQQRNDLPVIAREEVAQRVRAAAVASASEAEWVRRVRADGVVVKPRFAEGTTDVVVGYRAALKGLKEREGQDQLRFYGGGQLGRDLSLPRLRELWGEPNLAQADSAAAEWQAAHAGTPPTRIGREGAPVSVTAPADARANLAAMADRLANVPATDRVAWSLAAREVSGALSAWSQADPANRAVLQEAAAVIGRTAQDRRQTVGRAQRGADSGVGVTLLLMASRGDKPTVATAALMAQLLRTAAAIRDAHREAGNLRDARAVNRAMATLTALQLPNAAPPVPNAPAVEHGATAVRPYIPPTTRGDRDAGR